MVLLLLLFSNCCGCSLKTYFDKKKEQCNFRGSLWMLTIKTEEYEKSIIFHSNFIHFYVVYYK